MHQNFAYKYEEIVKKENSLKETNHYCLEADYCNDTLKMWLHASVCKYNWCINLFIQLVW